MIVIKSRWLRLTFLLCCLLNAVCKRFETMDIKNIAEMQRTKGLLCKMNPKDGTCRRGT